MPKVDSVLTIRSLGELAWVASRVGRRMIDSRSEPGPTALRSFWQTIRSMQRSWSEALDGLSLTEESNVSKLEDLAAQVFLTEMAARVWATILAGIDQQTGKSDLSRIALNAVNGLLQVRHQVISRLLALPVHINSRAAQLDRLRRRCDRWTDLLIGNVIGRDDIVEFAFDPERARDFAEESNDYDPCTGPNPVEHLVTAGLRIGFLGQLPAVELDLAAFQGFMQSILGSLPDQSFHRDGTLISPRELPDSGEDAENSTPAPPEDDVLLPGISFRKLRQRFR